MPKTIWKQWGQTSPVPLSALFMPLAALCVIPFVFLAAYLTYTHFEQERAIRLHDIENRLANIVNILDARLQSQVTALQLLADSTHADSSMDMPGLYAEALRARASFDGNIAVADTSLQMLFNTRSPLGTPLPRLSLPKGHAAAPTALATGKPAVGDVFRSLVANAPIVAVAVPIVRDSRVTALVIGTLDMAYFQRHLNDVRLPAGWAIELRDGNGVSMGRRQEWSPETGIELTRLEARTVRAPWTLTLEVPATDVKPPSHVPVVIALATIMALLISAATWMVASRWIAMSLRRASGTGDFQPEESPRIAEIEAVGNRLKETSDSLSQSEQRYRDLFMANPQPMWVTDMETLKFASVNNAAIAQYGYTEEEFAAMTVGDIHPPEDVAKLHQQITSMPSGIYKPGIMTHLLKDGRRISVDITVHPIRLDGRESALVSATDVTARLEAEEHARDYLRQIEHSLIDTVEAVSKIVELRDPYTAGHEQRVGDLSAAIAAEMGLDAHIQRGLRVAGRMHDIGKIGVPAEILTRPRELTDIEHHMVQLHTERGYEVLKTVHFPWPVADVARQHHERLDGSGYPQGLKGTEIVLEARITAVADVVESMVSHRPYRPAPGLDAALKEIEQGRGSLYDADAVDACLRIFREKHYDFDTDD